MFSLLGILCLSFILECDKCGMGYPGGSIVNKYLAFLPLETRRSRGEAHGIEFSS